MTTHGGAKGPKWTYSRLGEPMWEFPGYQAVLFDMVGPPFSTLGPPAMTDLEVEEANRRSHRAYEEDFRRWQRLYP